MGLHDHEDIEHVLGVPEDEQLIDEAPRNGATGDASATALRRHEQLGRHPGSRTAVGRPQPHPDPAGDHPCR